ncbi:MAG: PCYCGC motif-containing (lipo)protein [Bacilli bacterium]|jgi:hypothetical protein|uniref:PCYCGC motif-containing (lipo)protein n=1 Tax=unclassified Ureibacillus TaxID=2638520 RepID=UPI001EBE3F8A|nr:hypothetical protein [Bacilli bacterium]
MKKLNILIIFLFLLVACNEESAQKGDSVHKEGTAQPENHQHASHTEHNPLSGDLQQRTAIGELPSFLDGKHENVAAVYKIALDYADVLKWIPCYCGCGETAGHRSNLDCFIAEIRDEEVLWDDHGTRCLVCMEIAVESAKLAKEGKSIQEIRKSIDEKYQEGYSAPTPTDMPV